MKSQEAHGFGTVGEFCMYEIIVKESKKNAQNQENVPTRRRFLLKLTFLLFIYRHLEHPEP